MNKRKNILPVLAVFLILSGLNGCLFGPRIYLHPEADMGYYAKIAVLPLHNVAKDRYAADKIMQSLLPELLIAGKFEVVEPGEVSSTLEKINSKDNGNGDTQSLGRKKDDNEELVLDIATTRKLGAALGVQGIFAGSVREYEMVRIGTETLPIISLSLRLLDTETGKVVWMTSYTKHGSSGLPVLGYGRALTLSQLSHQVCRDLVGSFIREGF